MSWMVLAAPSCTVSWSVSWTVSDGGRYTCTRPDSSRSWGMVPLAMRFLTASWLTSSASAASATVNLSRSDLVRPSPIRACYTPGQVRAGSQTAASSLSRAIRRRPARSPGPVARSFFYPADYLVLAEEVAYHRALLAHKSIHICGRPQCNDERVCW